MSVEEVLARHRRSVGRFPSVALGSWEEEPSAERAESVKEQEPAEEGACRRWCCKVCSCCCRKTKGPDDIPDAIIIGGTEMPEKPPQPHTGASELDESLLTVRKIQLMTDENRAFHHTESYHGDDLIVRRGQTFQMWLELSRAFDADTDNLHLELMTGPHPVVSKGTHVIIPLVEELEDECWEAKIVEKDGKWLKLSVNSLPNALIGRYQLIVETHCPSGEARSPHDPSIDIYMLFNPWCESDPVYMEEEEEREEYVLNDTGRIYYGTEQQIGERTWNYGQFDKGVLAACLFILDKSGVPAAGHGDPVNVVRVVSAMINAPNDGGGAGGELVQRLFGWDGPHVVEREHGHPEAVPPAGRQACLLRPVLGLRWGHNYRCLGIPSRTVTNFNSAHDTDTSLTTDIYLDENLDPIAHLNGDSVWNFHVWNDCWMARPDLPPGMGGWQAVDSTPQETSQGTFRCGPASIRAVRSGLVYLKHDTPFVFAEVNSDKIFWQRNIDGTFKQIHMEKKAVGHCISTKAVGSEKRQDITHLYKHPEGTEEERIAVETACRYGSKPEAYVGAVAEDVSMEVAMEGEGPRMGSDVHLIVKLRNSSSEPRNATIHSQVAVMYYTGVHKATVKKDQSPIELLPNEVKTLEWVLEYKHYRDQLVDQAAMMLTLSGRVKETQQVLATQYNFRLRTPDLSITPVGDAVVGKEMAAKISFTNPLPRTLKSVMLRVEGLGLQSTREIAVGDVGSHATVNVTERFVPALPGKRKLLASLDCQQLTQVHGVAEIIVREN